MSFAHLHCHTEYSQLDGVSRLEGLADRVLEIGQEACAVTDHGTCASHWRWQKVGEKKGIKPIFGLEAYFVPDASEKTSKNRDFEHMTLLAVNNEGLANLWKLSSRAFLEGHYYKPRVDYGMLKEHGAGIIGTGGCLNGCVAALLNDEGKKYDPSGIPERLGRFLEIFGDRFYLEIHTFPNDLQYRVNKELARLGKEYGVPLLAVSDSHYLRPEDWEKHEMLIAAQMRKTKDDPTRYSYGPGALHVLSEEEVRERLSTHLDILDVESAITNTGKVADECDVQIEPHRSVPRFLTTEEKDIDHLKELAWQRFAEFAFGNVIHPSYNEYFARLEHELAIIIDKGFAGYFLIVADAVNKARAENILIGPGRGSAGGSLLAFVLGITEIDPIRSELIFERFLNPGRTSPPDIDIDVPQKQRGEVKATLERQYPGVATIGTLVTLAPKMLCRDFGRVLQIPMNEVEAINKIIDTTPNLIELALGWDEVKEAVGNDLAPKRQKYPELFELMDEFADHVRHGGAHAAGMVVHKQPLMGLLPLRKKNDDVLTQFDMKDIADLGYLKMDFLGLRTLSTLTRFMQIMAERHPCGCNASPDCLKCFGSGTDRIRHYSSWKNDWPIYEDEDVFQDLWDGRNIGCFQIETRGISDVTKRYRPTNLRELSDCISLFRPGITRAINADSGLNLMEEALRRREGRMPVTYKHPLLGPILKPSSGLFLYQEQLMAALGALAGYTLPEQDDIRSFIGKKLQDKMDAERPRFVERAVERGVSPKLAEEIFSEMQAHGTYSFNLSHGYAYAILAYWCAWSKHYFPSEFMLALFQTNEEDKVVYGRECRRLRIPVLGPDVNESESDFALVNGKIRYGLHAVKFVKKAATKIQKLRPYTSVKGFILAMRPALPPWFDPDNIDAADVKLLEEIKVTKRVVESLALVGAIDSIVHETDRYTPTDTGEILDPGIADWSDTKIVFFHAFERFVIEPGTKRQAREWAEEKLHRNFARFELYLADFGDIDDRSFWEQELLGQDVTAQPFEKYLTLMERFCNYPGVEKMLTDETAWIGGRINRVRELLTKKGKNPGAKMCQLWLEFPEINEDIVLDTDEIQVVVFPEAYQRCADKISEGKIVILQAQKLKSGNDLHLLKIYDVEEIK